MKGKIKIIIIHDIYIALVKVLRGINKSFSIALFCKMMQSTALGEAFYSVANLLCFQSRNLKKSEAQWVDSLNLWGFNILYFKAYFLVGSLLPGREYSKLKKSRKMDSNTLCS